LKLIRIDLSSSAALAVSCASQTEDVALLLTREAFFARPPLQAQALAGEEPVRLREISNPHRRILILADHLNALGLQP